MGRIAIVEDEPQIRGSLQLGLGAKGFRVSVFRSAEDFLATDWGGFDLVLIDLGLPKLSGGGLCARIRETDPLKPIIVITALEQESSAVSSFADGADDYVRKPFGLDELHARISRLLGRGLEQKNICRFEGLELARSSRIIRYRDRQAELTNKESIILGLLLENAGEAIERRRIQSSIDTEGKTTDGTLDSHISHLRKKLRVVGAEGIRISSVYGHGYKIDSRG